MEIIIYLLVYHHFGSRVHLMNHSVIELYYLRSAINEKIKFFKKYYSIRIYLLIVIIN